VLDGGALPALSDEPLLDGGGVTPGEREREPVWWGNVWWRAHEGIRHEGISIRCGDQSPKDMMLFPNHDAPHGRATDAAPLSRFSLLFNVLQYCTKMSLIILPR
jgi:hypothetical protein